MKIFLSASLLLLASSIPASATIAVSAPSATAALKSPFNIAASSSTCGGVPTVSMGYSIDNGTVALEPASFSTMVTASPGPHALRVKCWGRQTHEQVRLDITIVASDITVTSPAGGARVISPFTLAAATTTCAGMPATSMSYSIDGGRTFSEPASFSASITRNLGTHNILLKCYGLNVQDQVSLSVDVVQPPTAATPTFSLLSGTYYNKQSLSISESTAGATIYYTKDGSSPTTSSAIYTGPITVWKSMVVQAIAVAPQYNNSGLARASYTINLGPDIPSNAIQVSQIQTLPGWRIKYDPGTNGTANGAMSLVTKPSLSGLAAEYDTNYTYYGGVLYSVTYANDPLPQNFVYDVQVRIASGSTIGNLEMDNNQVMANGDTVIFSFQCSGNAGVWEYGENAGSPVNYIPKWVKSSAPCDPGKWTKDAWHHVQISYTRDDSGNATYHSVWVDGVETPINQTVPAAFTLGWTPGTLVANFQVDDTKATPASSTLYADNLTLYRW